MAVNKIPESRLPIRNVSDTDYVRIVGADGKSYRVPKTDFNGGGGGGGTVDPSLSPTSTNAVQNKAIYNALSSLKSDLGDLDDLQTTAKNNLVAAINEARQSGGGGGSVTVDSEMSSTSTNPVQNKVIKTALDAKADSEDLAEVATSGSYNDLSNKPTIPSISGLQTQNITDAGGYFSTDTVEAALQQLGAELDGVATILAAI